MARLPSLYIPHGGGPCFFLEPPPGRPDPWQPMGDHLRGLAAEIGFDPAHPEAGHAKVTIDLASAKTGDTQRDTALPQPEWFDTASHPQASFEADHFVAKGGDAYEAPGKLTIRGTTKDVVLPFTLAISGDHATAKGHLSLVRSDFGVGQGPWSSGQWVALEAGVDVDLAATRIGG